MGGVAGARGRERPRDTTQAVCARRDSRGGGGAAERVVVTVIAPIFAVLWLLGAVSSYTMGGFLHMFLLVAVGMVLPRVILGQKAA